MHAQQEAQPWECAAPRDETLPAIVATAYEALAMKLARSIQAVPRSLQDVCEAAADLAATFPDPDPSEVTSAVEWAGLHWNSSFAHAIGRLARTAMKMCELRMLEVTLVIRAMMELCANQAVINSDPKLAEMFSLQEQTTNEQLVEMLDKYGTGDSDEGALKTAQVKEMAQALRELGYDEFPGSFPPLAMSAKERFKLAGMEKYYDTFYSLASDFTHMNARAVHRYLDGDFDDERARNDIMLTTDMVLRCLIAANQGLHAGLDQQIEELVSEFRNAAAPGSGS